MPRVAVAVLALSIVIPTAASSAGLDLRWDDCAADGGVGDVTFDCAEPKAPRNLYGSFITDVPMDEFGLVEFLVDIQSESSTLPGFWNFHPSNPCYPGLHVDMESCPSLSTCDGSVNPYIDEACSEVPFEPYDFVLHPGGASNRGRIRIILGNTAFPIAAGQSYFGFRVSFYSAYSIEAGRTCDGCTTPMVMVLNQATLRDETGGEIVITGPGMVSNCVTTSSAMTPCGATPARNKTWGALKSLYR